jgi:hypothetical protein
MTLDTGAGFGERAGEVLVAIERAGDDVDVGPLGGQP